MGRGKGDSPRTRSLTTDVWLTPFDLGIRQQLTLKIEPGAFPEIYEVRVILKRLSGDDASWHRMNRTFLTELRKQFLQWRSLPPGKMLEYVEQSRAGTGSFSQAGALVAHPHRRCEKVKGTGSFSPLQR